MRIACLQFAPQVADVDNNLNKADAILREADPEDLDLLVLPELAFSGYNFKSLNHISPFLEESNSGISSLWARNTALKHDCSVVVGYPEKVDPTLNWPTSPEYYNSAIAINSDGETVANYRKTHLYYTDETWALEGSQGFFQGRLPGLGRTAMGICMDLNPYRFQAPWDKFEFAQHALHCGARLIILSMAWLTNENPETFNSTPEEPDTDTLMYWLSRIEPIIRIQSNQEVIVVFANRCGQEGEATYAGTSAVIGIQSGEIRLYGILGRCETDLLVVDTDAAPHAKLVYDPDRWNVGAEEEEGEGEEDDQDDQDDQDTQDADTDTEDGPAPPDNKQRQDNDPPAPLTSAAQQANDTDVSGSAQKAERKAQAEAEMYYGGGRQYRQCRDELKSSAPGPTPDSLRPQLDIPPHQYMLQRYLESESPISRHDLLSNTPLQSSMETLTLPHSAKYSTTSKLSTDASRDYCSPLIQPAATVPAETRWLPWDNLSTADASEKRHSLRSDVSVWNNQPGRVPEIAVPMTAPPELSRRSAVEGGAGTADRRSGKSKSRTRSRHGVDMSRQASESQLGKEKSRGSNGDMHRGSSSNAILQSAALRPTVRSEETDRGRRRSSQRQSRERRHRSSSGQVPHQEPIDLSQFALIEEYPSPNCPVHGLRPPLGTRRRNQSDARGRSQNRSRPGPGEDGTSRQSSHRDTLRGESRQAMYAKRSQEAVISSKSMPPSNSQSPRLRGKGNGTMEAREPTAGSSQRPKTPVAMVLVHDSETTDERPGVLEKTISPLKCVESKAGHMTARRMNSVW